MEPENKDQQDAAASDTKCIVRWPVVEQAAIAVLAENGVDSVCWGDSYLLDDIANRAGVYAPKGKTGWERISARWKKVMYHLEQSPRFEKYYYTLPDRNYLMRDFRLKAT